MPQWRPPPSNTEVHLSKSRGARWTSFGQRGRTRKPVSSFDTKSKYPLHTWSWNIFHMFLILIARTVEGRTSWGHRKYLHGENGASRSARFAQQAWQSCEYHHSGSRYISFSYGRRMKTLNEISESRCCLQTSPLPAWFWDTRERTKLRSTLKETFGSAFWRTTIWSSTREINQIHPTPLITPQWPIWNQKR